jgi:hypothetical protein
MYTFRTCAAVIAAVLISTSGSQASGLGYSGDFTLSLDVTGATGNFTDVVIFTSNPGANPPTGSSAGQFTIGNGTFNDPFTLPGPYDTTSVLLLGINSIDGGLALFSSNDFTGDEFDGNPFFASYTEANLVSDLTSPSMAGNIELNSFATLLFNDCPSTCFNFGFTVGSGFDITAFSTGTSDGTGTSNFAPAGATPLPSTWTMMLIGLAGLGFVAYRRQRQSVAFTAA